MSPELQTAVEERVALGYTKEQIAHELKEAGYDDAAIDAIYVAVTQSGSVGQPLPRNRDLITSAWSSMMARLDLVGYLVLPSLLLSFLDYGSEAGLFASSDGMSVVALVLVIGAVIASVLFQVVVIYIAARSTPDQPVAFKSAFDWACGNLFAWLWVMILTALIILGGWLLFLVPGIIASIYVAFSQYVLVAEGKKGMAAIQRSRELVTGYFGAVVWRLVVMFVCMIAFFIPLGILASVLGADTPETDQLLVVSGLEAIFSAALGVFAAFYMTDIFRALQARSHAAVPATKWYTAYAILGLVAIPLMILFFVGLAVLLGTGYMFDIDADSGVMLPTDFQVEQAELDAETQAELEALMQEIETEIEASN